MASLMESSSEAPILQNVEVEIVDTSTLDLGEGEASLGVDTVQMLLVMSRIRRKFCFEIFGVEKEMMIDGPLKLGKDDKDISAFC
ncbi:hypothetical protein QQ045_015369 [Rhodiola kirilowii]